MNVHHLELFYYVARHGGVSAAARSMPYGIQQPAISAQILQLEESLGVPLYQRRPFQLTIHGRRLYEFITPFFSGLGPMAEQLRGGREKLLRIAASEVVQRDYLPELLSRMVRKVDGFHFTLSYGTQTDVEELLLAQEIDVGLSVLNRKPSSSIESATLAKLPMVLLVSKTSPIKSARQVLDQDCIETPLISLNSNDAVSRAFQRELTKKQIVWRPSLELGSNDLVLRYVSEGFGVGLSLKHPRLTLPKSVRALPLQGFEPMTFGLLWNGKLGDLGKAFLEQAVELAKQVGS